jgi:prepilin-type N-terminal cleavage/methylation domain-containing protein
MAVEAMTAARPDLRAPMPAGFSLMEVVVATLIAAIAVIGLAHTFGLGRGQIERFSVARTALAAAEEQMSVLSMLTRTHPFLAEGQHDSTFVVDGQQIGEMRWIVTCELHKWSVGTEDYADSLRRAVVEVTYLAHLPDTIRLERLFEK